MGERSQIEWTDATWNPTTGCTKVSTGCDHCYAERLAKGRLRGRYLARLPVLASDAQKRDPFAVRTWPARLSQPARWREPRMVFVNSMSDLFHKHIPPAFVRSVFEVMLEVDHHTYQVLTKRPARAVRFWKSNQHLFRRRAIPSHIWIGTSVENQDVDYRIRHLMQLPAEVRFLSCEPLLGPLELDLRGVHWVIAGGESGPEYRPMRAEWVESIRDQCHRATVPFFFKQWGGRTPKAGGRELGGRTWNEYPLRIDGNRRNGTNGQT